MISAQKSQWSVTIIRRKHQVPSWHLSSRGTYYVFQSTTQKYIDYDMGGHHMHLLFATEYLSKVYCEQLNPVLYATIKFGAIDLDFILWTDLTFHCAFISVPIVNWHVEIIWPFQKFVCGSIPKKMQTPSSDILIDPAKMNSIEGKGRDDNEIKCSFIPVTSLFTVTLVAIPLTFTIDSRQWHQWSWHRM